MKSKLIPVILTAALTSVMTMFAVSHFQHKAPYFTAVKETPAAQVKFAGFDNTPANNSSPVNFEQAAESSVKAVVHIKTVTNARTVTGGDDMFSQLFGQHQYLIPSQAGSGSGVVISPDGYIVTNNHVVADANEVTVTFNEGSTMQAKVVAKDPSTDIAVIKVDGNNLPFMNFGNSDDVKLGQWVLAVGYPLSLDATVTAGIISAKGRSLGINRSSRTAIDAYLQTDAAVNPGNSGGALVNTSGLLIGINSAIASPTGSYAGYSYAIPSNIVRKAVNDLIKYGSVQRGYLGIQYFDSKAATPEQLSEMGINNPNSRGMYVASVLPNSGAAKAGIKKGDYIIQVNGIDVNTQPELQEQIVSYKPGDHVTIGYLRDGKNNTVNVELTNLNNTTDIIKEGSSAKVLGATVRPLTDKEKQAYNVDGGVLITDIGNGIIGKQTNIHKGFVIIGVNDDPINTIDDLQSKMEGSKTIKLAGIYPGYQGMYYCMLNLADAYDGAE